MSTPSPRLCRLARIVLLTWFSYSIKCFVSSKARYIGLLFRRALKRSRGICGCLLNTSAWYRRWSYGSPYSWHCVRLSTFWTDCSSIWVHNYLGKYLDLATIHQNELAIKVFIASCKQVQGKDYRQRRLLYRIPFEAHGVFLLWRRGFYQLVIFLAW